MRPCPPHHSISGGLNHLAFGVEVRSEHLSAKLESLKMNETIIRTPPSRSSSSPTRCQRRSESRPDLHPVWRIGSPSPSFPLHTSHSLSPNSLKYTPRHHQRRFQLRSHPLPENIHLEDSRTLLRLATVNSLQGRHNTSGENSPTSPTSSQVSQSSFIPEEEDWMVNRRKKLRVIAEQRIQNRILEPSELFRVSQRGTSRRTRNI
jgi:hypothetical protein